LSKLRVTFGGYCDFSEPLDAKVLARMTGSDLSLWSKRKRGPTCQVVLCRKHLD
jgi:hypothetical protein